MINKRGFFVSCDGGDGTTRLTNSKNGEIVFVKRIDFKDLASLIGNQCMFFLQYEACGVRQVSQEWWSDEVQNEWLYEPIFPRITFDTDFYVPAFFSPDLWIALSDVDERTEYERIFSLMEKVLSKYIIKINELKAIFDKLEIDFLSCGKVSARRRISWLVLHMQENSRMEELISCLESEYPDWGWRRQ